jgi:hypothetical protein
MRACNGEEDGIHLHIAALLGAGERIMKAGLYRIGINNFPLADTSGWMLTDTQNLDGSVVSDFAYHHADL